MVITQSSNGKTIAKLPKTSIVSSSSVASSTPSATTPIEMLAARGIRIGLSSRLLQSLAKGPTKRSLDRVLAQYGQQCSLIEWQCELPYSVDDSVVRALARYSTGHHAATWWIDCSNVEAAEYFARPEGMLILNQLSTHAASVVLAFNRSVKRDAELHKTLVALRDTVYPLSMALEFEHASWAEDARLFQSEKMPVVQIDGPRLPGIVKPISVRSRVRHLRLLGRNAKAWLTAVPSDRFAYDYTEAEVAEIAEQIRALRADADAVNVTIGVYPFESAMQTATALAYRLSGKD